METSTPTVTAPVDTTTDLAGNDVSTNHDVTKNGSIKPRAAKKAATKKPAAKKAEKPVKAKATEKKAPAPKQDNGGLRKPQVRILVALAKATKPLPRTEIATKAPVDQAACVEYLGSPDPETRKANDKKHFPSLVTLGLVRFGKSAEENGPAVYEITAAGRAKLAKIK